MIRGQKGCKTWFIPAFRAVFVALLPFFLPFSCTPHDGKLFGKYGQCVSCHHINADKNHDFSCVTCHKGDDRSPFKKKAHAGIVNSPSSPHFAKRFCIKCHREQVEDVQKSPHYTLSGEIEGVWKAFFPGERPPSIRELRAVERPRDQRELVEDLLARRCLRCHVYYQGDSYAGTRRGKGCAACHMPVGNKVRHIFKRPSVTNCLSCHYANFTGWDFVGRFEKDYPEDFRAPLKRGRHISRPYGVEWLQMAPDVHKEAGLTCLDCHKKGLFHVEKEDLKVISCRSCHKRLSDRPGHRQTGACRADCQACHALWAPWDEGRSLMRLDTVDPEEWQFLEVEGSSEVEEQIKGASGLADTDSFRPVMSDKIHGGNFTGLWLQGFEKRRWAPPVLGQANSGRIAVLRPITDMSLSYVDETGETLFDNLKPRPRNNWEIVYPSGFTSSSSGASGASFSLPFHPHTIGKADIFRTILVERLLRSCAARSQTGPVGSPGKDGK